jgi:hypothetical protein
MKTFEPIRITGIIVEEITVPLNDGTRGSALYDIPFQLSSTPPAGWAELFPGAWDRPSQWTSMHRPGICGVVGDVVWLRGTTLEEVERYHKATLQLALEETNLRYAQWAVRKQAEAERVSAEEAAHAQNVSEVAKRIKFD